MGQELTQVLCPECGTAVEADPELSRCQCTKCGMGFFLRRCSACSWVSYVDGLQGLRMPWPCTWCGRFNKGFSQNHDPAAATAAELAAEIARYARRSEAGPEAVARPDPARATDSSPRPAAQVPAGAPQSDRRRVRRIALSLAAAVACAAVTCVVLVAEGHRAAGMPAGPAVSGGATRDIQVAVGGVGAVDFQGVAGRLAIGGTGPGQVVLTGQLHGARGAPVIETRLDRAGGVLTVSIRCATASPCTENLRLAVPAGVGATVRQTGGQVAVAGLSGPLSITAANADVSVSGLRSPSLTAVITSGHLSTAFTAVPRQVSITLTSAQATIGLPGSAAYRVAQEVTSGYVKVAIPQAASATNTVTARIHSGELELMSS